MQGNDTVRNKKASLASVNSFASCSSFNQISCKLSRPGGDDAHIQWEENVETHKLQQEVPHTPLIQRLKLSTRGHRRGPYCSSGRVYRERCAGFQKLTSMIGVRPYRCV